MANVFDQFDAQNVFDQFDAPSINSIPLRGPNGEPMSQADTAAVYNKTTAPEPSLGDQLYEAAFGDPTKVLGGAVERIATKFGMNPAMASRLGEDVRDLPASLGPLGVAEMSSGPLPGKEVITAPGTSFVLPESKAATAEAPRLKTSGELLSSGASKLENAKASDATFDPKSVSDMVEGLKAELAPYARKRGVPGIDRELYDKAGKLEDRLTEFANEPGQTLQDLHHLRMKIKSVLSSSDKTERGIGYMMRDALDNFALQHSGPEFAQGLNEYARGARAADFENMVQSAARRAGGQFTGSGFENSLTRKLIQLADNPKRMRLFTKEQQDAINQFASGGSFARKAARAIGRFAVRGPVSGVSDMVIGHLLNGVIPGGSFAAMAIGEGGRFAATKLATKEAEHIGELIRAGDEKTLAALKGKISAPVFDNFVKDARNRNVLKYWLRQHSKANSNANKILSLEIAKSVRLPQIAPRIAQELQGLVPGQASENDNK